MIYKNPMQVKEIPIVFRGSVAAATMPVEGTEYFNGTVTKKQNVPGDCWQALITDHVLFTGTETALDITYDNVEYSNIPVRLITTTPVKQFEVGAPFKSAGFVFDDTEYPFSLYYAISGDQYIDVFYSRSSGKDHTLIIKGLSTPGSTTKKMFSADITGNGQINGFYARFACGENGTLHLKPYVILNGNIRVDLCNFAQGGDQYLAGDNETISFDCFVPVETHAVAYVEAENVGGYPSIVDAAMTVQYEDFIESESIVGYEGVNLRRGRR